MAYRFTEKKSKKQQENTYIVYMMLDSFFQKAICKTKFLEKSLYLYYKELSVEKQIKREEEILKDLETRLAEYLNRLEENNCQVHIRYKENNYVLEFVGEQLFMEVVVDKGGRYELGEVIDFPERSTLFQ